MERDFLGLNNKRVDEELGDVGFKDLGYNKSSGVGWNKVYGFPNFMSAGASRAAEFQDVMAFPAARCTGTNVLLRNQFGGLAQNSGVFANPKSPLLLGGIPITTSTSLLPTLNSFSGFMDPRNKVASSGSPQLTIFYAGTVNVFDGISPEKAQAIMLWAGNGSCLPSIMENQNKKGQEEEIISKPMFGNGVGVSSPISVSSSSSDTHSETAADTPLPHKPINVVGSFCAAANMIPSVPQARKASLARFLEKRKERLTNAMPYKMSKKMSQECWIGESSGMNYSATSAT